MLEMAAAGEHQCHVGSVGSCDHCWIALRTAGLHYRSDSHRGQRLHSVCEWKERVAGRYAACCSLSCLPDRPFRSAHATLIARSDSDGLTTLGDNDGIGFRVGSDPPGKPEVT